MTNLRQWRKSKELSQEELGRKLGFGDKWKTYQSYESGRTEPPQSIKDKLQRLGYAGGWDGREANDSNAGLMRDEFLKWTGRIERLENAFEKLSEAVRELDLRQSEGPRPRARV